MAHGESNAAYPHAIFHEISLRSIEPEGWLRVWLEKQRDGLTGNLDKAGYPFNTGGWTGRKIASRKFPAWGPYEPIAYWINGMISCGYLLRDERLIQKARKQTDGVLSHPDRDGYLGPPHLKKIPPRAVTYRWPHAVFFRALAAYYSATADPRVIKALTRHYLSNTSSPHSSGRDVCNVEAMLWTYAHTGNKRLLRCAVRAYEEYNRRFPDDDMTMQNMLSSKKSGEHGVTYNEIGKLGAVLYLATGKRSYLAATINAYRKMDRDHMLIDGLPSSSEFLAGRDALQAHETCVATDFTWGLGYLLQATGEAAYADKIEKACFNAAPGSVMDDFTALQYFSSPNQVLADSTSNHNIFYKGHAFMAYRPTHITQCCVGNVNRIMPNYVSRMWLRSGDGELVAALYGPSRVTAEIGKTRQKVTIVEETAYPFSEEITFQVRTSRPVNFSLVLRIPGWCRKAGLLVNGRAVKRALKPGSFVPVKRTFSHNDRITLILPMELKARKWPGGGVGIERGPLVYALHIKEDRRPAGDCSRKPAWDLYPASPWNYALALEGEKIADKIEVVHHPLEQDPWCSTPAPVELRVPARRISGWNIVRAKNILYEEVDLERYRNEDVMEFVTHKLKGDFRFTPPLPSLGALKKRLGAKVEMISLVPYGSTNLRMTIFPVCRKR